MEGQIQTPKYGFNENLKSWDPAYLLPKNMGDNFDRKMGQYKQFPIWPSVVQLDSTLTAF